MQVALRFALTLVVLLSAVAASRGIWAQPKHVALRSLLLLGVFAPMALGLGLIWSRSVNVEGIPEYFREKITPPSPLPLREPDALYRGGKVFARVEGVEIDETAGKVRFARITDATGDLTTNEPVLFRQYRLGTPASVQSFANGVYQGVVMTILP